MDAAPFPAIQYAGIAALQNNESCCVSCYGVLLASIFTERVDMGSEIPKYLHDMPPGRYPLEGGQWVPLHAAKGLVNVAVGAAVEAKATEDPAKATADPAKAKFEVETAVKLALDAVMGIAGVNYMLVTCVQQANGKPETVFCLLSTSARISQAEVPNCPATLTYLVGRRGLQGTGQTKVRGAHVIMATREHPANICWLTEDEAAKIPAQALGSAERWPLLLCGTAYAIVRIWHQHRIKPDKDMYMDAEGAKNAVTEEGHEKAADLQTELSATQLWVLHRRYIEETDWRPFVGASNVVFVFASALPKSISWKKRLVVAAHPERVALHQRPSGNKEACRLPYLPGCVGSQRLGGDAERQFLIAAVQQQIACNNVTTNVPADCIVAAFRMFTDIVPKARSTQGQTRKRKQDTLQYPAIVGEAFDDLLANMDSFDEELISERPDSKKEVGPRNLYKPENY